MFKKFNILIILLLLFISVTAVSAADDVNETIAGDEIENLEASHSADALDENMDSDESLSANPVTINNGNYNTYFDKNGKYKGESSEITLSGSFSTKNFTFNKTVSISGSNANLENSIITLLNGASGSSISNLKITNHMDATYGIFLNSASNCIIKDCTIVNQGRSSYPIVLGNNANYNNVTGNQLTTSGADYGHGTRSTPTLLLSGSHHNTLADNTMNVDDANAIYLSSYSGGPLTGGESNYNLIINNTVYYHVLPTSWSYSIMIMGSYNTLKSNKVIGAYRGITTTGVYNTITENWIINLTGADYNNNNAVATGGEYGIAASSHSTVTNNHIVNAKIISTGAGISAIDRSVIENNDIDVVGYGKGVSVSGYDVMVRNNNISTERGVGIHEYDESSGLTVTENNIKSVSGIGILIEKINSKRMPSNVTITYNDIKTNNEFAIDASGVRVGTETIHDNAVYGKKINQPSGVYDDSKPSYKYDESKTYTVTPENIGHYVSDNGNLIGNSTDGAILKFVGTFSNQVIYINKAIKIVGENVKFLNSTFKVTSGGVWIENLTIINKKSNRLNAWGIYVNGASGVKIIKNNISVTDPNAAYAIYVLESTYVEVLNNTLFSDGDFLTYTLLSYSSEDCIFANNTINALGTGEKYRYSPESSIEGTIYDVNGTEVCVDGSTVCIDGVVYCLDGSVAYLEGDYLVFNGETYPIVDKNVTINGETYCIDGNTVCIDGVTYCLDGDSVCIDGNVYCLDGDVLIVNGVSYTIEENQTVCIDGVTYCLDGNEITINGVVYCLDGSVVCLDGNEIVYKGERYQIVDNNVTINGETYCIDGNTVCIDGVTYCIDGNFANINGTTYCIDGNELFIDGSNYGKTNHMVPEIYRTYGILLLYSSNNEVFNNTVNVTSKLDSIRPTTGANASENSIVGIDVYYNSHNNIISNNRISVTGNDNYIYGVGVLGYKTGHNAPQGQGADNNKFIGNVIDLNGPYSTTGVIIGQSSSNTLVADNIVNINSDVTYGVNLEGSHTTTIKGNEFSLNSQVAYVIEGFNSNYNIIENNKLQASGKQVYGMVMSGNNNEIINNDIVANGNGEEVSFKDHDSFGSGNAGIYLFGNATENIIKSNNITSQKGFAVIVASSGNTIENNYLRSEKGNSTAGINSTSDNIVKNNFAYRITGEILPVQIHYMGSGVITLEVKNPENMSLDGAIVSFYDDYDVNIANCTVSNGKASFNYYLDESYGIAQYSLKAVITKEDFEVTTFVTEQFLVIKGELNIAVADVNVKEGIRGKFTATVTNGLGKPVEGFTVRFYNYDTGNRQAIGTATTDANGVATIVAPIDKYFEEDFGKVTHITAVIQETEDYAESNGTGLLTIIDIAPINIDIKSKVGFNGVLAVLTDNNGLPVANKDVALTIDGKAQNVKTNAGGEVILPSVSAGSHTFTVASAKDSIYDAGSKTSKATVVAAIEGNKNANVYFGNTVQYKIRVADREGNYLKANSPVTIKVNGKAVNLKADANGYVAYNVKKVGTYTITAEYNGQKVSNKIVIKPTLTAKNIVKKKSKKIKFTVKVVDKKGKAVKKKKVTFKVKGKKYTAKTNKKGVATVTLKNLKVGKHTITSSYGGCAIKNTIKIKK